MTEPTGTPATQQPPSSPPNDDEVTKAFWSRLGTLIDERIDAGVERIIKKHAKPSGTRNASDQPSLNLPGLLADIMFGKKRD